MSSHASSDEQLDLEDIGFVPAIRNMPRQRIGKAKPPRKPTNIHEKIEAEHRALAQLADAAEEKFEFSYKAGPLEAEWLYESLYNFHEHKWINDVLRMVKGGKEASVYLCSGNETTGEDLLAAKVYRPRKFRSLKNDWLYREGRGDLDERGNSITNKGQLHAIHKRTEYGRQLLHLSWLEHEYKTMQVLFAAGVDVPQPYATENNAILMSYYGDELLGAPTLNDVDLERSEAKTLYERMVHNIETMLAHDRIHGDLSAFNILYWDGDIVIIDFPQAVQPNINQSAYKIFERDVVRVCEYFGRQGVRCNGRNLALDMWEKHHLSTVPQVNPKILDEENEDRALWESLKNS